MADIANAKPEPFSRWMARLDYSRELKGKRLSWWHRVLWIEWAMEHLNYGLRSWAFVELLGHAARFTLLVSVILAANKYFFEAEERRNARHSQAWAVIAAAAGKSGDLGRKVALETLVADRVPLHAAPLSRAFLAKSVLAHAILTRSDLENAQLRQATLMGADLREANLQNVDLSIADLQRADLKGAIMVNANLGRANLVQTSFWGADLRKADIGSADLRGAILSHSSLNGASLRSADLTGAYLVGTDLGSADLKGAKLENANLDRADLGGAKGLNQRQLNSACFISIPPLLPNELNHLTMKRCKSKEQ